MPTNEEICKVLTEEILGKCWHEHKGKHDSAVGRYGPNGCLTVFRCDKCNIIMSNSAETYIYNPDFSDRNQLGELYDKIQEMGLWEEFIRYNQEFIGSKPTPFRYANSFDYIISFMFDPDRSLKTVYPWWKGRGK